MTTFYFICACIALAMIHPALPFAILSVVLFIMSANEDENKKRK